MSREAFWLICEIQEKYNETLVAPKKKISDEKGYRLVMNFSYYDVLALIESQLNAFGLSEEKSGEITPVLGRSISFRD